MAVAAEVAAIRALEAAYDKARPAGDLDAMVRCLRGDAVVVSPRGEWPDAAWGISLARTTPTRTA